MTKRYVLTDTAGDLEGSWSLLWEGATIEGCRRMLAASPRLVPEGTRIIDTETWTEVH